MRPPPSTHPDPAPASHGRRALVGKTVAMLAVMAGASKCWAQDSVLAPVRPDLGAGIDVLKLVLHRAEDELRLDFQSRVRLSRTVEEALKRGVAVHFLAQATVNRQRWWWRDERLARTQRSWRLAYQPLTANWRLGGGGLGQSFATLDEALQAMASFSDWPVMDLKDLGDPSRCYVDFVFKLDTSQLPGPMQIGVTAQSDWNLSVERSQRLD